MIDTIRVEVSGRWNSDPFAGPIKPKGETVEGYWGHSFEVYANDRKRRKGLGEAEGDPQVFANDKMLGIVVEGDREGPKLVQASLPRMIYPSNGHLLTRDEDIRQAVAVLLSHVSMISADVRLGRLRRVDLCWQFELDCSAYLRAAAGLSWGLVRQTPMVYPGESITWGRRSPTSLCLYDKGLESEKIPGGPLRVEVRFKNKAECTARKLYDCGDLTIGACYPAYRAEVLKVPPVRLVDRHTLRGAPSLAGFLAVLEQAGSRLGDEDAADWYLSRVAARTRRRLRAEMAAQGGLGWVDVDWAARLPESGPPEAVHAPRVLAA